MKPLVNYCRWNGAKLRLLGRDDRFVRGQFVFVGTDGEEEIQYFQFETVTAELTIFHDTGAQAILLDDMGVPRRS